MTRKKRQWGREIHDDSKGAPEPRKQAPRHQWIDWVNRAYRGNGKRRVVKHIPMKFCTRCGVKTDRKDDGSAVYPGVACRPYDVERGE